MLLVMVPTLGNISVDAFTLYPDGKRREKEAPKQKHLEFRKQTQLSLFWDMAHIGKR